jgi:hypothetical protein
LGKLEKLIQKLLDGTGIMTYQELTYLLGKLGYAELKTGKTSGSKVAFWNADKQDLIRLHKPHPGNELKDYQRKLIKSHLQARDLI